MTVHARLYDEGSLRVTDDGRELVELFMVTEVYGSPGRRFMDALDNSRIPDHGKEHPQIPGLYVTAREVTPRSGDNTKFVVRVTYSSHSNDGNGGEDGDDYGGVTWSISTRSEEEETTRDIHGNPMIVNYRGNPQFDELSSYTGQVVTQSNRSYARYAFVDQINITRPLMTLTGSRWERDNPERTAYQYQGATNLESWRGYTPETMLIREISAEQEDGGGFRVRYTFQYNPKTWRHESTFQPLTTLGPQTPHDAQIGNGIELFQVYPVLSFSRLRFPA